MLERRAEVVDRLKSLEDGAAPLVTFLQNPNAVQELRVDKQYNLQMLNDRYQNPSDLLNNASEKNMTGDKPKLEQSAPILNVEESASLSSYSGDKSTRHKTCIEELAEIGDLEFDFEPSLIDVFPDITPDSNPDDFFDFDGISFEQFEKDMEGSACLMEEELEESEIA